MHIFPFWLVLFYLFCDSLCIIAIQHDLHIPAQHDLIQPSESAKEVLINDLWVAGSEKRLLSPFQIRNATLSLHKCPLCELATPYRQLQVWISTWFDLSLLIRVNGNLHPIRAYILHAVIPNKPKFISFIWSAVQYPTHAKTALQRTGGLSSDFSFQTFQTFQRNFCINGPIGREWDSQFHFRKFLSKEIGPLWWSILIK